MDSSQPTANVANIDVHLYRTRSGRWRARVEWGSRVVYTEERDHRISVLLDVHEILTQIGKAEACGSV